MKESQGETEVQGEAPGSWGEPAACSSWFYLSSQTVNDRVQRMTLLQITVLLISPRTPLSFQLYMEKFTLVVHTE